MVRILCCALLFCAFSYADVLDVKILNLVGDTIYNRNKNFINKLFTPKDNFYQNGALNIKKVITTLQDNGLINPKFNKPTDFNIIFSARGSPIFLLKSINKSLSRMEYSYFLPSEIAFENGNSIIKISLVSEHIIDPKKLLDNLFDSGYLPIDVIRNASNEWRYELILVDSKIPNSTFVAKGNSVKIRGEVGGEYWLEIASGNNLEINANGKRFSPKIVFFDRNLNVLGTKQLNNVGIANIGVAENTKFIKIQDAEKKIGFKSGMNVRLK